MRDDTDRAGDEPADAREPAREGVSGDADARRGDDDPTILGDDAPTLDPDAETIAPAPGGDTHGRTGHVGSRESASPGGTLPPGTPERVGSYRVVGVLGTGGMGVVYRAEQERPQREVALKLMRAGAASPEMLRRFEFESELLGRLAHPGIAQVYEAGIDPASGAPFFAMELVHGRPLSRYVEENHLGTRERLRLFAEVCRAVQYAHSRGVIHRDLKPDNILVTEVGAAESTDAVGSGTRNRTTSVVHPRAQPKILDFGVARLTDADVQSATLRTDIGQLIGTVPYMSPEQVEGDPNALDTRSDVYALGVILYELLVGRLPYDLRDRLIHEAVRVIREEEPTRLSSIDRALRGDVETIVGKALEKQRDRRYQTAEDLAADIGRYLDDEPITARPASTAYQLSKFARRHRALVGGIAATFVVLVAGLASTAVFAVRAEARRVEAEEARAAESLAATAAATAAERAIEARGEAEARAAELEIVADFQAAQLSDIRPAAMGETIRADLREQVEAALVEEALDDDPRAAVLGALDDALSRVNFTDVSLTALDEHVFERALVAIDEELADQPHVRARLLQSVARSMRDLGMLQRAVAPQARAIELLREAGTEHEGDLFNALHNLGELLRRQGRLDDAVAAIEEAIEGLRRVRGADAVPTLNAENSLAITWQAMGRREEALALYERVLDGRRRVLGDEAPSTFAVIGNIGTLLAQSGRLEEAEPFFEQAYEGRRRVLGEDHADTMTSLGNLSTLYAFQGRYDEAAPLMERAYEARRRLHGETHPMTLSTLTNLAILRQRMNDPAGAERAHRRILEARLELLGDRHPDTLDAMANVAGATSDLGRLEESRALYERSVEGLREVLGPAHSSTLRALANFASLLGEIGDDEAAAAITREAWEGMRASMGDDHPFTLSTGTNLGLLLLRLERDAEAEVIVRQVHARSAATLGPDHDDTLRAQGTLAEVLMHLGELEEADALVTDGLARARAALGERHARTAALLLARADLLLRRGAFDDAIEAAESARAIREEIAGPTSPGVREAVELLVTIHDAAHAADPTAGHDGNAANWRAWLEELSGG